MSSTAALCTSILPNLLKSSFRATPVQEGTPTSGSQLLPLARPPNACPLAARRQQSSRLAVMVVVAGGNLCSGGSFSVPAKFVELFLPLLPRDTFGKTLPSTPRNLEGDSNPHSCHVKHQLCPTTPQARHCHSHPCRAAINPQRLVPAALNVLRVSSAYCCIASCLG